MHVSITGRVHAIGTQGLIFPVPAWVYLVLSPASERVLLIDCGARGAARAIDQGLRAVGRSPADLAAVALTHWHSDHTGALAALLHGTCQPVTIYGGAADLDAYLEQAARTIQVGPNALLRRGTTIRHRPGPLPARDGIAYERIGPENAAEALREWGVEALATPGHSAGHTAYHVVGERAVCCGDALVRIGRWLFTLFLYHDPERLAQSARHLLGMDVDWLLPAHFSPVRHPVPLAARLPVGAPAPRAARLLEGLAGLHYQATIPRG